jgi:hypothetical protein
MKHEAWHDGFADEKLEFIIQYAHNFRPGHDTEEKED